MSYIESIAGRIERDRQRIEPRAIRRVTKLTAQAMRHAVHAIRQGYDPATAATDVMIGNSRLALPGLIPSLTRMLVMSDLMGRRRSLLNARARMGKRINLSRDDERNEEKELALLLMLLTLDDQQQAGMFARYRPVAANMAKNLAMPVAHGLQQLQQARISGKPAISVLEQFVPSSSFQTSVFKIGDLPRRIPIGAPPLVEKPVDIRAFESTVRAIFRANGIVPQYQARVESWVHSEVTRAYERGRFTGWQTPIINQALWGFHYSAILDNRTTNLCRSLNGMIAPKDDPVWSQWTPPNHFNCRSCLIEVWSHDDLKIPAIIQPKATVADIMRFREIKRKFQSYQ